MATRRVRELQDPRPLTTGWEVARSAPRSTDDALFRLPEAEWLPAPVPGTVAMALAGCDDSRSDDGFDSRPAQRLDASDWWYRCQFDHADAPVSDERWFLRFEGLATIADVWLNGAWLLRADNMFVTHAVDVSSRLAARNELVLHFHALDTVLAARRPRPSWRAPMIEHQQLRWVRTTLLGRTPGWSPSIPAIGPWRPVVLERRSALDVQHIDLQTSLQGQSGVVHLTLNLQTLDDVPVRAVRLRVSRNAAVLCDVPLDVSSSSGVTTASGDGHIECVERWWPHTHGEQPLYDVCALVTLGETLREIPLGGIGFRELLLDAVDGAFSLAVNGVRVFCRGACWMPLDAASLGASPSGCRAALEQIRAAGMNMLRIVGSTVYESDAFHDLCDELGILVWQDFMFSNMDYPNDAAFMANVDREARQVLRRWQGRPSMAVLCGNSEGEQQAAMWGAPRERWTQTLFNDVLPAICREICPDVPYWPSSSSGGAFPHQPDSGTSSYYGVGAYLRPLDDARRSNVRFASECLAFANVPEDAMLERLGHVGLVRTHTPAWKAGVPRDVGAGWDFEDVRDHYLAKLFDVDPVMLRSVEPDRYLALSRVVTGEVMVAAFSEWRRAGSCTSGALVWFLRDLVPGAGWGVIDSDGTPKAAFHYLRRVLNPFTVLITDEGLNGVCVHVVNERSQHWSGTLRVQLFRNGEVVIEQGERALTVAARDVVATPAATLFGSLPDTTYAYRFGPPSHDLVVASLVDEDGCVLREAFHFPVGRPSRQESDLGLTAVAALQPDGSTRLALHARRFAQAVSIDAPGFEPDDNYLHLAPGRTRYVTLRPSAPANAFRGGKVLPLNASAGTRIVIQTDPSAPDTTKQ